MSAAESLHERVLDANVALHSRLADRYDGFEPHFRPENLQKVGAILADLARRSGSGRLLDLGCGTGFVIGLARKIFQAIDGVDVTEAMLNRVDRSGPARIRLFQQDATSFSPDPGAYDLVTAYSFLHHLYDPRPVFKVAWQALKPGGLFYADLDPNRAFWDALAKLDSQGTYDPIVERERKALSYEDEQMRREYGVDRAVFDHAEYGKNIRGGFSREELIADLTQAGFRNIQVDLHWFLGEAQVIHDPAFAPGEGSRVAGQVAASLGRLHPLSDHLFKYVRFVAQK